MPWTFLALGACTDVPDAGPDATDTETLDPGGTPTGGTPTGGTPTGEPPAPRQAVALASPTAADLLAVWVDTDGAAWVADADDQLWELRDGDWSLAASGPEIHSLWRDSAGALLGGGRDPGGYGAIWRQADGWAVDVALTNCAYPVQLRAHGGTTYGACAYYDGIVRYPDGQPDLAEVFELNAAATADVVDVFDGEVYALRGYQGVIHRFEDGDWTAVESWAEVYPAQDGRDLSDLWSLDPSPWWPALLVAVGTSGRAAAWDGAAWTEEQAGEADLFALWGSATDGLYAVGADGAVAWRGADAVWESLPAAGDATLRAVHGQPGGRILAVGDDGAVVELIADGAQP
jgi:hypothetical protein